MADQPRLILVLGGARSGKSTFAEKLASAAVPPPPGTGRVVYLATSQAHDDEMRRRVARHRADRPLNWTTVECPLEVPAALRAHAATNDVFLLDCVTFWVTNLLLAGGGLGEQVPEGLGDFNKEFIAPEVERAAAQRVARSLDDLEAALRETGAALIAVSNEVGLGLVPEYPLSRLYRDELGRANARLAAVADQVYFLAAGLPLELKSLSCSPFSPEEPVS